VSSPLLTPALKERWDIEGWCVIPGVIPPGQLAAAQEAAHRYFPTPAEMAERGGASARHWHTWDSPWPEFPFHSSRLNALVLHDGVVDIAEGLLGTSELLCYMGLVTAKYAHQASGYNQLLHADYPNHMLVVPRHDKGYQQAEFFVYLTDVSTNDGATRFVSWQKTRDIPVERHTLNYVEYTELYEDSSDASAPAGSVVAYRPDVYHRSIDHTDPTRYRVMIHVSFRHRDAEWGGYQAWPFRGFSAELSKYVQQASPRQLALLGIPLPGHSYWTEDTVAGVQARYPGLDMAPWRAALAARRAG
jgi:Phytanoyl-CoA dioxygenase (PhyH)